ncbi:metal-dependent hydrolase [Candidatus Woesearchaeota archaeon]|nr:metal-dependent hydrolase [Candidatus Woesearchaeota archaeon]
MMYKTHAAFGFLIGLLLMNYFNVNKYVFLSMVVLGSIFVDIDEDNSYIGRKTRPVSNVIERVFGHRGIFHSLLIAGLIFIGFSYFGYLKFGIGFLVGYVSHLAADALTIEGVRIFYPFSSKSIHGLVRTNGVFEKIFFILVLVAIGYVLI